ncbi:MAG TPA: hypothetical protein V6D33_03500 [Cyanophyceae cyanobacterium]
MGSKNAAVKGLKGTEAQAQTRLLLALWDLGGSKVRKSQIMQRVVRSGERTSDYQTILRNLEECEGILIDKAEISLNPQGLKLLNDGLVDSGFEFNSQVGATTINALLKWIRQSSSTVVKQSTPKSTTAEVQIKTYEEFLTLVLETYDRLNRDYNFDDLVPIYRIRREIGTRTSRSDFNSWLLKMQSNDLLQLQGGSVEDSAPDKIEDSIKTEVSGLRCYAKRLS